MVKTSGNSGKKTRGTNIDRNGVAMRLQRVTRDYSYSQHEFFDAGGVASIMRKIHPHYAHPEYDQVMGELLNIWKDCHV